MADTHWFHDDKEIYKNKRYHMSYEESNASLTITGSEPKDAGAYRCEASNKLGRVTTQCTLTVQSMYSIVGCCKYRRVELFC